MSDKNVFLPSGSLHSKVYFSRTLMLRKPKREMAEICALEIIRANTVGEPTHKVKEHFKKLAEYAD